MHPKENENYANTVDSAQTMEELRRVAHWFRRKWREEQRHAKHLREARDAYMHQYLALALRVEDLEQAEFHREVSQ
jgi:rubrerythrin